MIETILSTTMKHGNNGNEEIRSYKENELKDPSHLRTQIINKITSTKVENVHGTPKNVNQQCSNNTNHTNENTNSPQKDIYLYQKDLLKNPILKRSDKSVNTTQTKTCPQRRRTISSNSDCNTFKLELCTESFNNFEGIDLLHDLDSTVKFEDSKDIFLTSMMDGNTMQEDDSLLGVYKDPVKDPLSISDCEKKDPEMLADLDSKIKRKLRKRKLREESEPQIKRQRHYFKKQKISTKKKQLSKKLVNFEKWEEVPLIYTKKLMELHIKLIHKVPPQHEIELSGSHAPTRMEKMLFQNYGPIRKGSYTPIEDKIIRENWETFCKLHDWDIKRTEPFLSWRHDDRYYIHDIKERQKFVQFLANKLPWRTLYSVYSRFKILYRNKITYSRYTSKEDKQILKYMENEHLDERDTKYSELARILRRTSRSVFKRYRFLKNLNESEIELNIKWTLPLIKKFIKTLLDVTLSEDVTELQNATLPKPIWEKMEEKLNIHQIVLRAFWQHQLHLQLFSTGPIYLNDIKIQLIEYMYAKGISNTREIIWPNVAKYFNGATAVFLCKVFFYLVQECNMSDVVNFADVVEYLYHTKIPEIKKAPTDKFLPKITYKNGKISVLNENSTVIVDNDYQKNDYTDAIHD